MNGAYVYTQNNVAAPLVVTLTSTDPTVAIPTVSTVTIPTGSNIGYFQINALDATGTIQIQATATGIWRNLDQRAGNRSEVRDFYKLDGKHNVAAAEYHGGSV